MSSHVTPVPWGGRYRRILGACWRQSSLRFERTSVKGLMWREIQNSNHLSLWPQFVPTHKCAHTLYILVYVHTHAHATDTHTWTELVRLQVLLLVSVSLLAGLAIPFSFAIGRIWLRGTRMEQGQLKCYHLSTSFFSLLWARQWIKSDGCGLSMN